ncbi:hypothetical protein CUT44_10480 [Streptomyces carminius]|uniref:Uncharacterized protein n=1 Tax=Streptomyces carminius TaxID=2665496 RepID=A0A2M8LXZ1_9ACTN|nr:hypothetical protein [Streptomyces carminius]PJE93955.1 hypothetical protein CUT44_30885 [Streptomyces carminius]PJE96836.1 hypothetical protein CUT44_16110 [Streptomyces carminius]PJE97370.1 hypothetical protein CUT44_11805 [Streptomyces carminius]PJE97574.1 hypothetical protein CUT44_10480 [Streptomyces carminius]
MAYRAEVVAYCGVPGPGVCHLGGCFSPRVGERAVRIAASLGPEAAARFLTWAHEAGTGSTRRLLCAGRAVVYSHTSAGCLWELSLRPVPQVTGGM